MRESELRVCPTLTYVTITRVFAARLNLPTAAAKGRYLNGSIMRGRLSPSGCLQSPQIFPILFCWVKSLAKTYVLASPVLNAFPLEG